MSKKILFIILIITLLIPLPTNARELDWSTFKSSSLEDALKEEEVKYNFKDYDENVNNKITIYLFYGSGCPHCQEFLEYVSKDLIKKYGDYFKIVTYEVWNNTDNARLMNEVANFMNDPTGAVPYIIIGDTTFSGYAKSMNSKIEAAIKKEYEKEKRYDVLEGLMYGVSTPKKNFDYTILIYIITSALIVIIISIDNNRNKKEILRALKNLSLAPKDEKNTKKA